MDDTAALTYLANLASLELHVPQWRVDGEGRPLPPDRLVIDLDPGSPAGLHECARLALAVRERLTGMGLASAPVTSGSKGMQLYAALPGDQDADEIRDVAREIAQDLTRAEPELVVWKMTKSLRPGKVLLDWSQNTAAKTTIAPYSLRGKDAPSWPRRGPGRRWRPAPSGPVAWSSSRWTRCSAGSAGTATCSGSCCTADACLCPRGRVPDLA